MNDQVIDPCKPLVCAKCGADDFTKQLTGYRCNRCAFLNDAYKPAAGEVIAGALDIGISEDGREVVVNAADVVVDEKGRCFFKFSPRQARHLARVMADKAEDIEPIAKPLEPMHPRLRKTIRAIREFYARSRAVGHTRAMLHGMIAAPEGGIIIVSDTNQGASIVRALDEAGNRKTLIVTLAEIDTLVGRAGAPLALDNFATELLFGQVEAEFIRLGMEMRKAIADWHRFQDFIIGEGPTEMFRLQDAKKRQRGVMEGFLSYVASLWNELRQVKRDLDAAKELRRGDSKLICNLAEAVEIHLTAPDNMLGILWEQFHGGVVMMKERLDRQRETIVTYQSAAPAGLIERLEKQNANQAKLIAYFSGLAMTFRALTEEALATPGGVTTAYVRNVLEAGKIDPEINTQQFLAWLGAVRFNDAMIESNKTIGESKYEFVARMAWNAARGVQNSQPNG